VTVYQPTRVGSQRDLPRIGLWIRRLTGVLWTAFFGPAGGGQPASAASVPGRLAHCYLLSTHWWDNGYREGGILGSATLAVGRLLGMARCELCGKRLGVRRLLGCGMRRTGIDFPTRSVGGEPMRQHVRWICPRCEQRAERRRVSAVGDGSEAA